MVGLSLRKRKTLSSQDQVMGMQDKMHVISRLLRVVNETLEFFDHKPYSRGVEGSWYEFQKVCMHIICILCVLSLNFRMYNSVLKIHEIC